MKKIRSFLNSLKMSVLFDINSEKVLFLGINSLKTPEVVYVISEKVCLVWE